MMSTQSATQFAAWLALNHPGIFREMLRHTPYQRTRLAGLGDASLDSLQTQTVEANYIDPSTLDTSSADLAPVDLSSPDMSSVDTSVGSAPPAISWGDTTATPTVDLNAPAESNSSGFWGTVGNALSAVGSGAVNAVSSVGSWLTSSQGMNTLAGVAKDYFGAQAISAQASAQQSALQLQVARANAGLSPAPVSYAMGANGQLVPIVGTNAGFVPATRQSLSTYLPGATAGLSSLGSLTQYMPYILMGGGFLFFAMFLSGERR